MKKLFVIVTIALQGFCANAQPWLPANNKGPIKLQDIVDAYKQSPQINEDEDQDNTATIKEGKNYQFDRWLWYWNSHTDENGFIVPTMKTWTEWQTYLHQSAQQNQFAKTSGVSSNWTFQGPSQALTGNFGLGRINCIAFHPVDTNTIWIGSAGGGPWKSTDNGSTWTPMYNNLPVIGVSDIDINPLNPNTMYICTGDGDGGDTHSVGVFKSTDGGNTWDTTGLQWNTSSLYNANSLVINPLDTNTVLVASTVGIYRSLDAGAHWIKVKQGVFKQIVYNPADTSVLYAATYNSANIFRSADGGATWQQITTASNIMRIALAVTPANPAIVKAVFSNTAYGLEGIYSSSDSGKTFVKICSDSGCANNILSGNAHLDANACGGQGWYDLCITINPTDSNQVLVGGVNTYQSTNGGLSWSIVTQWTSSLPGVKLIHADKHFMAFNPLTPSILYQGNDGGIFRALNPASQLWTDLSNGLAITQFYRVAVSNIAPYAIGGAQDNGCKMVNNGFLTQLTGADGMECQMDYTDTNTFYTSSQYGSINRTQDHGAHYTNISNNISSPAPTGAWVTPFMLYPQISSGILAGFNKVYLSTDYGQTWNSISPAFYITTYIDRITTPLLNSDYIYVMVNNGLRYSPDFGNTWHNIVNTGGTLSDIVADPKIDTILWATYSGYGANKVGKYSVPSNTWTYYNTGLPDIPVNCMAIDSSSGTQYIGTDMAVFYKDTSMTQWALYNNNLPNVVIDDMGINYTTNELWAATFGRGFWKTPKYDQTPTGISIIPFTMDVITVSPNPNRGHFTVNTDNKNLSGQKVNTRLINSIGITSWQANNNFNMNGTMTINAEGLPKGVYILEVSGNNTIARSRVIIY